MRKPGGRQPREPRPAGERRGAQRPAGGSAGEAGAHGGRERALEGDAGFYHAYAGNNRGDLTYSFVGDTRASLAALTAGLGETWLFLETLYRIYSTAGYNIAHIEVTAQLCAEHGIRYEDVDRVEAVVNWLETQYPSPAFPTRREDTAAAAPGRTKYFTAYGVVRRGLPRRTRRRCSISCSVTIIPSHDDAVRSPHHHLHQGRAKLLDFDSCTA